MKKNNNTTLTALAELLRTERPNLMRYACYRLGSIDDAKDILQDTFLKMHARMSDMEASKVDNLRNYLFRSLSNLCTSRLVQQKKKQTIPLDSNFDRMEVATEDFEEDFQRISTLLNQIPQEQAEVIRLRMYGNNSFAEVAEILSLPLPTVKSQFFYGLDKIRKGMKSKNRSIKKM